MCSRSWLNFSKEQNRNDNRVDPSGRIHKIAACFGFVSLNGIADHEAAEDENNPDRQRG